MKQRSKKRTSDAIDNLLARYLADEENGLLILSSPTGSGKSYALQRLMAAKALDAPGALGEFVNLKNAGKALKRIKRMYYNTPLKSNLPGTKYSGEHRPKSSGGDGKGPFDEEDEESRLRSIVRQSAEETGRSFRSEDEFNCFMSEHFLFLDAKSNPVIEKYPELSRRNSLPASSKMGEFIRGNQDVCDRLLSSIDQVRKSLENDPKNPNYKIFKDASRDDFDKAQSAFCLSLKKFIAGEVAFLNEGAGNDDDREIFRSREEFAREIRWADSEWNWIGELYPAVYIGITPIVILSTSKMYRMIDPIIEPSFNIYLSPDHKYVSGSVIIYDEIDAVKEWLLGTMIEDAAEDERDLDLVPFLDTMELRLQSWQNSGTSSLDRLIPDATRTLENITNRCHEIWTRYYLDSDYKTEPGKAGGAAGYVFYDAMGNTQVVDGAGRSSHLACFHDEDENLNRIFLKEEGRADSDPEKQSGAELDIRSLIRDTQSFIYQFASCVNHLADKYCEEKQKIFLDSEGKSGSAGFTSENAVKTVLDEFHLDGGWGEYLSEYSLELRSRTHYSGKARTAQDRRGGKCLYTRGISLLELNDRADHDMRTKFSYHSFNTTPESLLLGLCRTCPVIGVSATAGLKNIKNFDIDYLGSELGDNYHSANNIDAGWREERYEQEFREIEDTFRASQYGYTEEAGDRKICPEVTILPDNQPLGEILRGQSQLAEEIENMCRQNTYPLQRYVNLAYCMRDFFTKDMDSFLAVCDKFPREDPAPDDNNPFSMSFLQSMWNHLKKLYGGGQDAELYIITSNNFKEIWEECRGHLGKGGKAFILSTAKTIGNGQNLQYRIPGQFRASGRDGAGALYAADGGEPDYNGEKDIDAIYIEMPSHVLEYFSSGPDSGSYKQLYTYILYAEYAYQYGYINYSQKREILQEGFSALNRSAGYSMYRLSAQVNQIPKEYILGRIVIQAIGRICRTPIKKKSPRIYLDPRLQGKTAVNGRLILNPEAEMSIEALSGTKGEEEGPEIAGNRLLNRMHNVCAANIDHISSFQYLPWNDSSVEEWESIRDRLLRLPQPGKEEFNSESTSGEDRAWIYRHYLDRGENSEDRKTIYYKTNNDFRSVSLSFKRTPEFSSTITAESTNLASYARNITIRSFFERQGYALDFCEDAQYVMDPATAVRIYMGALGEAAGRALFDRWIPYSLEPIRDLEHYEYFDYKFRGLPVYVDFKNWNTSLLENLNEFTRKVSGKISSMGEENGRLVFIANILAPSADRNISEIIPTNNGRIVLVPSLLDPEDPAKELDRVFREINRDIQKIKGGE